MIVVEKGHNPPEIDVAPATSAFFGCRHCRWEQWGPRCRYTVSCLDGLVGAFMIVQHLKGSIALHRLRCILAILIAFSLTLAPIASAWADMQMRARIAATVLSEDSMSDCMKAMQLQPQAQNQNCPCCEAPSKSMCPDGGACLAKCSVHVFAVLAPAAESHPPALRHDWPADPQEPPDWAFVPPAPPPRA